MPIEAMFQFIEWYASQKLVGHDGLRNVLNNNRSDNEILHPRVLEELVVIWRNLLEKPYSARRCRAVEALAFEASHHPIINPLGQCCEAIANLSIVEVRPAAALF